MERVVNGDNSVIQVAGYSDFIIDLAMFGDVLHVPRVGQNPLSLPHFTYQ
jgi:hypothetical protein